LSISLAALLTGDSALVLDEVAEVESSLSPTGRSSEIGCG
jgi:hypothetical protein